MSRRTPAAGFTLLELLVAMTVLALLTALLFGGLQFGTRVWRLADAGLDRFQQLDAAYDLMHRTLMAASPKLVEEAADPPRQRAGRQDDGAGPVTDFDGQPDGVSFVAPAPAAVLGGGLYRLTFAVVEHEGAGRLMFALQPLTAEAEASPETATMTRVLLDGIERARFAYFGLAGDAEEATWYDRWENQAELPKLVSVQIEFGPGDRRVWPQLLVAPLLSPPVQ
jgi:general secretion pathway protein J